MSKFCIKCGTELDHDAAFCDDCGAQQVPSAAQAIPTVQAMPTTQIPMEQPNLSTAVPGNIPKQSGFGIAALILGIISLLTLGILIIPEILGIIFGIIGILDKSKKKSLAIAGAVLSIFSALLFLLLLFI